MESLYNKLGITAKYSKGAVPLGVSATGVPLYGSPKAIADNSPDLAARLTDHYQTGLNVIGAATKEDNAHLDNLKNVLKDPQTLTLLDNHRAKGDAEAFGKTISKLTGHGNTEEAKAAFDAWGVMTPNQKGASIMHIGGNAQAMNDKEYLPGVPTGTALELQKQGIPMKDVRANWQQVSALNEAIGHEGDSASNIKRIARGGYLGPVQKLTENDVKFYGLNPAPQYGVGALEMPQNPAKVPQGYTVAGIDNGKQIVVPQGNEASVAFNPQVNGTAGGVYSTWKDAHKLNAVNGSAGGSAMYKKLTQMFDINPTALGKTLDSQIAGKGTLSEKSAGLAHSVLTTGDPSGAAAMNPTLLPEALGKAGIQSRDVGYKLANQAYAEGRINDSHLFAIQRSLDNIFHGDTTLHQIAPILKNVMPVPVARIDTGKKVQPGLTGGGVTGTPAAKGGTQMGDGGSALGAPTSKPNAAGSSMKGFDVGGATS